MIVKSVEFDKKLHDDLNWIKVNAHKPVRIKGSYTIKKMGDILSDIDIQASVYFTPNLLKIIHNIIQKNRYKNNPFTFIHMIVGKYKEFTFPWLIDNEGGCYYSIQSTKKWFSTLKKHNLVPNSVLDFIAIKLFSKTIKISDLIDVENVLYKYSGILWEEDDIIHRYKYVRGVRYDLLEEMTYETPVMEYLYSYMNEYINIDFALVDTKHMVMPRTKLYPYYTNNYYKIMKTFRWKLKHEYTEEYLNTMKKVEVFIAIKYKISTIQTILLHRHGKIKLDKLYTNLYDNLSYLFKENKRISLEDADKKIDYLINDILKDKVNYYLDKVAKKDERRKILFFLLRGIESQKPISHSDLEKNGMLFPYFTKEYNKICILANRLLIDQNTFFECFVEIAVKHHISLRELIQDIFPKNKFNIGMYNKNMILLRNFNKTIGIYNIKKLHDIQLYIMIK